MKKLIKYILSLSVIILTLHACKIEPSDNYSTYVQKQRFAKDSLLKFDNNSPLDHGQRVRFVELSYYAPDSNYRVMAKLVKNEQLDTITIEDTHKALRKCFRFAKLNFSIKGKPCSLFAYKMIGMEGQSLFVPFYDLTNGKVTHDGGRYLDLEYHDKNEIELDFNFAYNPYCAYSQNYGCPIPPAENKLNIPIEAGEKEWKE